MSNSPGERSDRPRAFPRGCTIVAVTLVVALLVAAAAIVIFFESLSRSKWPSGEPAPPDNATAAAQSVADKLRRSPPPQAGSEAAIRKAAAESGMSVSEVRSMTVPVKAVLAKADATMIRCFEFVVYSKPDQTLTGFTPLNSCPTPTT